MRAWPVIGVGLLLGCSNAEPPEPRTPTDPPAKPVDVTCDDETRCPPCAATSSCVGGDPIIVLGTGGASEVVDVKTNGRYVVACGGFGGHLHDAANPASSRHLGSLGDRCQNSAFGASDDGQVVYVAHHGDTWVTENSLSTYLIVGDAVGRVDILSEPGVLYEGVAYYEDHVYVAAHGHGVRVYSAGVDGKPAFIGAITEGLINPIRLAVEGDRLFVADSDVGVVVMSLADPSAPVGVATVATKGRPANIDATAKRVYVAEGGLGVEVLDRDDDTLEHVALIDTKGSAVSVAADDDVIVVGAWSHVAVYDAQHFVLLATEHTRPRFEQTTSVALAGDTIFAGEWEALYFLKYRPSHIAPDLWLDEQQVQLPADVVSARALVVENRGHLPLRINDIVSSNPAWTVDRTSFLLAPGERDSFELHYAPSNAAEGGLLTIESNDPDRDALALELVNESGDRLQVGDSIGESFNFLDIEGHVTVLAYFALF